MPTITTLKLEKKNSQVVKGKEEKGRKKQRRMEEYAIVGGSGTSTHKDAHTAIVSKLPIAKFFEKTPNYKAFIPPPMKLKEKLTKE
ncbi:hypothetical protein RJT34_19604 [Clitoria ternatea]|uniref:Uncharacterized protein n=1 Tax=Clitoria ternatea TaxID=43366 RepID=A0AAN9IRM0_CLITE